MPWEKSFDAEEALDKAMQLFWTRGYEATSMQDLVSCMGVNRGSLYATYGDKRALFLAALRMYDSVVRHGLQTDAEARFAPRDAIRHVFLAFTTGVSESGGNRGCFATNTALELAPHDSEVREVVAHTQEEIERFFRKMIERGKSRGEIPPHVKPAETARSLLASLIGLVVLTRSRPDTRLLQAIVDDAMRRLD